MKNTLVVKEGESSTRKGDNRDQIMLFAPEKRITRLLEGVAGNGRCGMGFRCMGGIGGRFRKTYHVLLRPSEFRSRL